jgi:hypothetical protein
MLKRNVQRKEGAPLSQKGKMTNGEYAAFSEAFDAVKGDYQTLCLISDKLREVERASRDFKPFESQASGQTALPNGDEDRQSPWEICASLMKLDSNEVLLCKRVAEHGTEYAVIDRLPAASAYAKASGPLDILQTSDDPCRVVRDYLRSERRMLGLVANDITATVREFVAERFPRPDSRRVVNEIAHMCKKILRHGFSEALSEVPGQAQKKSHGVRM